MMAAITKEGNALAGMSTGQRHDFSREMLDPIDQEFDDILA